MRYGELKNEIETIINGFNQPQVKALIGFLNSPWDLGDAPEVVVELKDKPAELRGALSHLLYLYNEASPYTSLQVQLEAPIELTEQLIAALEESLKTAP